jgi:hypothetical protein
VAVLVLVVGLGSPFFQPHYQRTWHYGTHLGFLFWRMKFHIAEGTPDTFTVKLGEIFLGLDFFQPKAKDLL